MKINLPVLCAPFLLGSCATEMASLQKAPMQLFRAALVALALGLSGCAATALHYKGSDAGYVVASLLLPATGGNYSACLYLRRKGESVGGGVGPLCFSQRVSLFREDEKREHEIRKFQEGNFLGGIDVRPLPPGEYEVFNYAVFVNEDTTIRPNKPLSIPFTIKPGGSTYIGQYQWSNTMGKGWFGQDVLKGATLAVANRMARDMEKAAALRGIPKKSDVAVPNTQSQ